ncbi:MAG: hypothetical protein L0Z48_00215 [candidate division Zixibacteria bacterium]|nr:hypothetical protein [candidate division Zixibacteria bacterium]MCI0594951.1 hypothetical protein [candidate division Zixibacteria bacterium]
MRRFFQLLMVVAAGFLLVQCGKKTTETTKVLPYGRSVHLDPVDLPEPPSGMVYQAWTFRLEKSGASYSAKYFPYRKMGWVGYPYRFTDPVTGEDIGYDHLASPDDSNLFTQNLTAWVRADTIAQIVETVLRGQSVVLTGLAENLSRMQGFLFSLEPAGETGPDTATPARPFLAAYSNDSGKFEMIYPYNYRHPDFIVQYFLASPTDTLYFIRCACNETDSTRIRNEAKGIWFGVIDTLKFDRSRKEIAAPDTVLRKLSRELMPGWQFEGWAEKGGQLVSLGRFSKGDSSDLSNPYAFEEDSAFLVPGEDFQNGGTPAPFQQDVLGARIMITLEPNPDPDPAPFPVILFQDTIPATIWVPDPQTSIPFHILHLNLRTLNRARFFPKIKLTVLPEARGRNTGN